MPSNYHPFEYKAIKYAIIIQNVIFGILLFSLIGLLGLVIFTNPYESELLVWLFWVGLWSFMASILAYGQFWWEFSYNSNIIQVAKVNTMCYRSMIYSALLVYIFSLFQSGEFNLLYFTITLLVAGAYHLYSAPTKE